MDDAVFQGVREGTVAAVVKQDGDGGGFKFLIRNHIALAAQQMDGASHQVHGAEAVGKACMVGARIHQVGHADLFDAPKPLEIRVFDDVEMQFVGDADEAINRIVEDFLFVWG